MNKLIKKYKEFLNENAPAQTETEEETIVKPAPTRRQKGLDQPSVNPDPLAELHSKLKGSELKGNTLYYDGHEIEYPSELKGKEYVSIDGTKVELKKVADYLDYYDVNYEKPELSDDVTVGEEGLNDFNFDEDPEYQARVGKNTLKESKSYKNSRNFNKTK